MEERRWYARYAVKDNQPCLLYCGNKEIKAHLVNISEGGLGLLLSTDEPTAVSDKDKIGFQIYSEQHAPQLITGNAIVVHRNKDNLGCIVINPSKVYKEYVIKICTDNFIDQIINQ